VEHAAVAGGIGEARPQLLERDACGQSGGLSTARVLWPLRYRQERRAIPAQPGSCDLSGVQRQARRRLRTKAGTGIQRQARRWLRTQAGTRASRGID
ncbi:MAG: hypothetical protein WBF88_06025, partial [Pusillimonas sp.]